MSDGLYVSPAIETADYHASLNKNSWFYVFDYQTKYGDYATVRCWAKYIERGPLMSQEMFYYPNFPLSLFLLYHGKGKFYEFAFSVSSIFGRERDYMTVGKSKTSTRGSLNFMTLFLSL